MIVAFDKFYLINNLGKILDLQVDICEGIFKQNIMSKDF
jgi:hypothetical protein